MNPIDPWVITPREMLKYQQQFKQLQPRNGFVTGGQAKGFFLQSQLPPLILGQIWALADTDSDGKMNINEFSIACKLINLKLRGMEVPKLLPPALLVSLTTVPGNSQITPTSADRSLSPLDSLNSIGAAIEAAPLPVTLPGIVPQLVPTTAAAPLQPTSAVAGVSNVASGVPDMAAAGSAMIPAAIPGMAAAMPTLPGAQQMIGAQGMQMTALGASPATTMPAQAILPGVPGPGVLPTAVPSSSSSGDVKMGVASTPPQSQPPSRNMSISERAPSIESPQMEWAIKGPAKLKYTQVFNAADRTRSGYLTGVQARGILVQSKLPQAMLAQIWTLSDLDCDGRLSCDEFILAMFLCDKAMNGEKIPIALPPDWLPPSFRKTKSRPGSVVGQGSRAGSTTSSRHASISSQGAADLDPLAGLPQTSFEDKRKENFDKGQAELDRRRKLLLDQQRKEREERERKEREEADKREKARLELERKQQEELERQLQKQREIEMEKEEQRKRELDAKEAARKELEKQRQLEWEQARIAEMNAQKQREQERVLKQKAQNTQLNVELSTLNEKIKDLSQRICDTRAGVTNVKSVIDGMRSERDISMSEMTQLKARIKEQNAKLLQLTQERAKWDAKVKASGGVTADMAQQEQLNAAFSKKQLIIKQIKDKVDNIRKDIDSKKEDINSNDVQAGEVKAELSELIKKCEELYADYDTQRTQVLELKYNKKNESISGAVAGWGDSDVATAWGSSVDNTSFSNDPTSITAVSVKPLDVAPAADTSEPAPDGFVKYRAIYEFNARNADEITFVPGDIIFVPLEQNAEPGWLAGEINGHTGWFPETYVEKLLDDYDATNSGAMNTVEAAQAFTTAYADVQDSYNENKQMFGSSANAAAEPAPAATAFNGDVEYYIATYPYESTEAGDLSFSAGEMVMVTKKEGEWWTGTIGNRTGMFPSNYVQKADVGNTAAKADSTTANSIAAVDAAATYDDQNYMDNNVNGNAQSLYEMSKVTASTVETQHHQQQQQHADEARFDEANAKKDVVAAVAPTEELRTLEDLDTEVSQINTQSKNVEQTESYSRPMSRTSSMTPGMRAKRSEIAQVIAPYEATSSEQLSLTRGQLIMIRKKTDSGWWEGELQAKGRRRQIGWFPATYVKVLQGGRNSGRNTPVSGSRIEMTEQILDKVIALYPYKAQNDDELSFDKDDIISVLGRDEPEWWRGELNRLSGLFPSNYVGPFVTSGKKAIARKGK